MASYIYKKVLPSLAPPVVPLGVPLNRALIPQVLQSWVATRDWHTGRQAGAVSCILVPLAMSLASWGPEDNVILHAGSDRGEILNWSETWSSRR